MTVEFYSPSLYYPGGGGAGRIEAMVVDGQFFRVNGQRWTGIESSEFSLPKRFMAGEEIRPLLDERAGLGFNMFRMWLLNQSVVQGAGYPEGIHPNQYPNFYDRVRALAELLNAYGIVSEFTAFTSCDPLMTNEGDQQRHWTSLQDAVRGIPGVLLELVNEWDWGQGQNSPARSLYNMKPSGIIASSGSSTADAPPPMPVWDYVLYHSNGLSEWQRKVGHNTMEPADEHHCPGGANENMRYPDEEQSTAKAYDAAAGAALLCAFACFHSQGGKYSRPFDVLERACAAAWVEGARSVPLEFQAGRYVHRSDLEDHVNKTVLRAYERVLGDGRAHLVLIRY
jgi:hypothetical protein